MSTKNNISRRDFLKGAATLSAAAVVPLMFPKQKPLTGIAKKLMAADTVQWKASFCSGCHQPTCATQVKVSNGVVVGIQGDPKALTNQGTLCARGLAAVMSLYNPYRVKAPMKRTNPVRGLDQDPGWVEISWNEALDTVAAKITEVKAIDTRGFIMSTGFGFEETRLSFAGAIGKTNSLGTPGALCPEHYNSLHMSGTMLDRADLERANYMVVAGRSFGADFAIASSSTRHLMDAVQRGMKLVTISPVDNRQGQIGEWVPIRPGTDTALGLALGYVIIHELGKYDEWWLKVRTNAPYLIPLSEQILDGNRVFMDDYLRDPVTKKPLVYQTGKGAVPFDTTTGEDYELLGGIHDVNGVIGQTAFQTYADYIKDFTPEWAEPITTIPAAKIREIATNLVNEAKIGATIEIDGYTFPYSPACIDVGRGAVTNKLGTQAYKAYAAVNLMLGNIDVPGGMQGCQTMNQWPFLQADADGVLIATESMASQVMGTPLTFPPDALDMTGFYPQKHNTTVLGWKAILDPEKYYITFPVKMLMLHAANPVTSNANMERVIAAWNKLEMVVDLAYHYDEVAYLSDILLPEDHSLERTNMYRLFRNEKESTDENRVLQGTFVKNPAVSRTFNTMNVNDIFIALAKRVGILPALYASANKSLLNKIGNAFKSSGLTPANALDVNGEYTWDEIVERKIKSDFGPDASFATFEKSAFIPTFVKTVKESYNYSYAPGNAVRLHFYYQRTAKNAKKLKSDLEKVNAHVPGWDDMNVFYKHYSGFPIWYKPYNFGVTAEYPFKVANWKTHFLVTNTYGNVENPWLQEIMDKYQPDMKVVLIHPATAKKVGLQEGDAVVIQAELAGTTNGKVHITNLVHPEVAGIAGNFGRLSPAMNPIVKEGSQFNQLLSDEEFTLEPLMGCLENSPRVKITKA